MATIDSLDIQIEGSVQKATTAIDSVVKNLDKLAKSLKIDTSGLERLGKINSDNFKKLGEGAKDFSSGLKSLQNIKKSDFNRLASGIERLSSVSTGNMQAVASTLKPLADGVSVLSNVNFDNKNLQGMINSLTRLSNSNVSNLSNVDFTGIGNSLKNLTNSLAGADKVQQSTISMTNAIAKLAASGANIPIVSTSLSQLGTSLSKFMSTMSAAPTVTAQTIAFTQAIAQLSNAGGKAATTASNLGALATELKAFMKTMSNAPVVSDNTIRMTQALADLASQGNKTGSATQGLQSVFSGTANMGERFNNSIKKLSSSMRGLGDSIKKSASKMKSFKTELLSALGIVGGLYGAIRGIQKSIDISSDLVEVQNVVDTTFKNMSYKVEELAKTSIEQFGLSELSLKQFSSRFQAMGTAMGFPISRMSDMSIELTKLTADMSSFYNVAQEDVARSLQSIFTGETEPLRKYGLDLTQATLQEWALKQGLDADMRTMSQMEKTMLRYQYVMANTAAVHGDFERTSGSWANQIRILRQQFEQLASIIGTAFVNMLKPVVQSLNKAMAKVIEFAQTVINALGKIFGWKLEINTKGIAGDFSGVEDGIGGITDGIEDATEASKKFNKQLQGFDKLNNLTTSDAGKGLEDLTAGLGGAGDIGDIVPSEGLLEGYESFIDNFYDLGRYIGETLQHALANIPWEKIKQSARNLGKGIADLINGFVEVEGLGKAIGYSIAQALNTAFEFANSYVHTLHWDSIGKFIAETINGFTQNIDWSLIRDTLITGAKGLADAINSFVDYLDWDAVADTISNSINALSDTIIMFFERTDWSELGHKVGYTLEKSIEDIDFERVGRALADILQSALDFASGVIAELDWGEIKSAIKDLLTGFFGNITIPDNLKGIITALVGIEGAVLSLKGVMGTAKLSKSFSDIWDAAKKIQKLNVPKIFTDIKGAFSPFANAFKQFKKSFAVSGDLFASFKNGFSSLSSGLEAFRAGLSPVTKGVVGLTAVFAEFKIVGNAFDDIIKGTGNLSASIGKIVAAAGAAATALSVVFGVPAGIIIAGVTAAVAGLKSLNDHFNELEVERVGERIRDSLSSPGGVSLDSIVDQYADSFAEMRGQFTNISDQAAKVDMLDDSITNVYRDIDKIRTSMNNGVISVEEGTEKLRTLFTDLETVTAEKFGAIEDTLYSAFGENGAFRKSYEEIGGNAQEMLEKVTGVTTEMQDRIIEINQLQMELDPLSEEYQKLEEEKKAITGSLDSVTESFNKFATDISSLKIDYSDLVDNGELNSQFDTTITSLLESGKAYQGSIKDSTNELINQFTELANAARATGDEATASYFEQQAELARTAGGDLQSQVGEQAKQVTDKIQSDFIDAIGEQITKAQADWDKLETGEKLMMSITKGIDTQDEYVKSQLDAFKTNTLDPMSQQIDEALTQLGVDGAGWASDATQQIMDSLFDTTIIAKGTYVDNDTVLASDWISILDNVKETVKPKATEAGQYIGQGVREGMSSVDLSADSQKLFDILLSGFNLAAGIASPAKNMMPSGQYITLGIIEGFKSKFDAFTAPIQQLCNSITSKISNGLQNMKNTWSNIWNSLPNVVTGVINRITSSLSTLVSNIANAFSNITSKIRGIGSAFSGLSYGTNKQSMSRIKGYAAGGFPESYSLFMAGEQGRAEILGTVGGKTAVAGGNEITGIANAVYSTGQTEAQLLSTAVKLLQIIADKDFGMTTDEIGRAARDYNDQHRKRTGSPAFT